jgi:hypothetical protein
MVGSNDKTNKSQLIRFSFPVRVSVELSAVVLFESTIGRCRTRNERTDAQWTFLNDGTGIWVRADKFPLQIDDRYESDSWLQKPSVYADCFRRLDVCDSKFRW